MSTPKHILEALGPDAIDAIALRLGRSHKSVRNAASGPNATFPAAWFEQIRVLCEDRGVECPTSAFSFFRQPGTAA